MQGPDQGYINHIGLVLDASSSMSHLTNATVQVADNQVAYLAQRSKEMDQETRITCYTFSYPTDIRCIYYDKDVLRMPSLRDKYRPNGNTALVDATLKAIADLRQTATLYGDHAFLLYVLTDGQENSSRDKYGMELRRVLQSLPDNWTVAVLVPDNSGIYEAKKFGFLPENIAKWDTTAKGIAEVGEMLQRQTDVYMTARTQGIRSTRGIFSLDINNLTKSTVAGVLTRVPKNGYSTFVVQAPEAIKPFVEYQTRQPYQIGKAYYQFTKPETIQPSKQICVRDRNSGDVYTGTQARQILGLPLSEVRVSPADHPDFDLYIQSTSVNRKLVPGTEVLVLK